jgi:multicomponent K+:H+ antiporter subunit E
MKPETSANSSRSMFDRWFPHPVLSGLLAVSWLALSHSLELVHWLSALLLAWVVPYLVRPFLTDASRLHWPTLIRLTLVVLWDIVVSNLVVARITLGSMERPKPAWLRLPLRSRHPRVNALLASIITMTPGTVSAAIDEPADVIWVHALNCDDQDAMVADIHTRYEVPLLRIFGLDADGKAMP